MAGGAGAPSPIWASKWVKYGRKCSFLEILMPDGSLSYSCLIPQCDLKNFAPESQKGLYLCGWFVSLWLVCISVAGLYQKGLNLSGGCRCFRSAPLLHRDRLYPSVQPGGSRVGRRTVGSPVRSPARSRGPGQRDISTTAVTPAGQQPTGTARRPASVGR